MSPIRIQLVLVGLGRGPLCESTAHEYRNYPLLLYRIHEGADAHRPRLALRGHATRWNEIKQLLRDDLLHKWDNQWVKMHVSAIFRDGLTGT